MSLSSSGAESGTVTGGPNSPGLPPGFCATADRTNAYAAWTRSVWQAYSCLVAAAMSQPCTTTSLIATCPATSPGRSTPPARVRPAQAVSSCQARARWASRPDMRVRQSGPSRDRRHRRTHRCWGCWLPPLAGLVVPGGLLGDDVQAVPAVDDRDERHQARELVLVVVLDGVRPGLVGHPAGGVGEAGALLGQFQGGPFGLGEDRGLPPGRDQVESHRGFPGVGGVLSVHVGAVGAAVDLAGPDLHQVPRRGRQARVRGGLARRAEVLRDLRRDG